MERKVSQQRGRILPVAVFAAVAAMSSGAMASTLTQNTSWTIDRSGTTTKYRVTAYGDSIYAGYYGSISRVAKRAPPWGEGEYLSARLHADVEVFPPATS